MEGIADDLRQRIRGGRIQPGEPIGSLDTLRGRYGAAQNTIRDALKLLATEGLVYTVPGKGTFVAEEIQAAEPSDRERLALLEKRVDELACQMMDTRAAAGLEQWQPDDQAQAR